MPESLTKYQKRDISDKGELLTENQNESKAQGVGQSVGKIGPFIFIPTLYFAEGLPFTIVNQMSVVFFKAIGATNEFIGLTSFLYIPWAIKLLWAPFVDFVGTRRNWILFCQLILSGLMFAAAFAVNGPNVLPIMVGLMFVKAMISATQDIAIDGFYMDSLDSKMQAYFIGVRNTAYKVAWLFGSGALVYFAGVLQSQYGVNTAWSAAFGLCGLIMLLSFAFHSYFLPRPVQNRWEETNKFPFIEVFITYFSQKGIIPIVLYILSFRLGDALMLKMAQPFLLDDLSKGGLAMSVADVGLVYGTVGMIFLLLGGLLGGFLISKDGIGKWLWPSALIQNSAIVLYYFLAIHKPGIYWVAAVNSIEQFAYGLGVAAYTVLLLNTVRKEFKAAHYAISTALMALGMMLPQAFSGYLSTYMGYANFFLFSFLASIPGIITIFFLPLKRMDKVGAKVS